MNDGGLIALDRMNMDRIATALERIAAAIEARGNPKASMADVGDLLTEEELVELNRPTLTEEEEQLATALYPQFDDVRERFGYDSANQYFFDRETDPPSLIIPYDLYEKIDPRSWIRIVGIYREFCGGECKTEVDPENQRILRPRVPLK